MLRSSLKILCSLTSPVTGHFIAPCRTIYPCAAPDVALQSFYGALYSLSKGPISLHRTLHSLRKGTITVCGHIQLLQSLSQPPSDVRVSVCPTGFAHMQCSRAPQWATTVLGCLCAHLRARLALGRPISQVRRGAAGADFDKKFRYINFSYCIFFTVPTRNL